jgi:histidinol-phosphate aminotransferase
MPALWKIKQPYNVNVAATQAALASLSDLEWLAGNVERLRQERDRLYAGLNSLAFLKPYPSQTNFILCRVSGLPAADLKNRLAAQGILVRHYTSPMLASCIRVSVGRPQDTDRLLAALEEFA